jgi:lipopolysaccharide/colanic/teichoic acid biosynthesis glycosyltransferase
LSLDELPQLINVLRGEMSLVGPRAYLPAELERMRGRERPILRVRPGITGLWQVSGRNQIPFEGRLDLDVRYIRNWSVSLDLYLLARTVPVVLTGQGAA